MCQIWHIGQVNLNLAALAGPKPSSLKIDLKAPMLLFRTLYKSFVGLV